MQAVLEHVLDEEVAEGVFRWILNGAVDDIERSLEKLDEIMRPHESLHPITYN